MQIGNDAQTSFMGYRVLFEKRGKLSLCLLVFFHCALIARRPRRKWDSFHVLPRVLHLKMAQCRLSTNRIRLYLLEFYLDSGGSN
jgi:hypothetical protein